MGNSFDALFGVPATRGAYGGNAAAVFLDGRDPGAPTAAELRANFLFRVPCSGFFLRWLLVGAQCAALLLDGPSGAGNLCLDDPVPGVVVSAIALGSFAR